MNKRYKNTPNGRTSIPNCSGIYTLLDKQGKAIYKGKTDNLRRRIKEHHYDKSKSFSYIIVRKMRIKDSNQNEGSEKFEKDK